MKKKVAFILAILIIVMSAAIIGYKRLSHESFDNTVMRIQDFKIDGYTEIMKEKSHVLGVPIESERIADTDGFIFEQKLFVYKNEKQKSIILLQITRNEIFFKNSWNSSIDFNKDIATKYNGDAIQYMPKVEIAANSFTRGKCNYQIICISNENESLLAGTVLTEFSNELIRFLEGGNLIPHSTSMNGLMPDGTSIYEE